MARELAAQPVQVFHVLVIDGAGEFDFQTGDFDGRAFSDDVDFMVAVTGSQVVDTSPVRFGCHAEAQHREGLKKLPQEFLAARSQQRGFV